MAICPIICSFYYLACTLMHNVVCVCIKGGEIPQLVAQHCFVASFRRCFLFFTLHDQLEPQQKHLLRFLFFTLHDQLEPQQKHLLRVEEMRRADWLICLIGGSKMAASQKQKCAVAVVLLGLRADEEPKNRQKRKQKEPTRQWIRRRKERGAFHQLVKEITVEDEKGYRNFFRLSRDQFQ